MDGSRNMGATGTGAGTGYGTSSGTGAGYGSGTGAGTHNSSMMNKTDPRIDSDLDGSRNMGATGAGHGSGTGTTGTRGTTGYDSTGAHSKPSLMDKLNPMKDADHDGKKGVME